MLAAVYVSAQQFITFTTEKVELKKGMIVSVPDTTAMYFDVDSNAWREADKDVDFIAIFDLKMTIEDVLEQGYALKIIMGNESNAEQTMESKYTSMEIWLSRLHSNADTYGEIDLRRVEDDEFVQRYIENSRRENGLLHERRAAFCWIKKI